MKTKNTIKMKEINTETANIDIAQKNKEIITRMEKCIEEGIEFIMQDSQLDGVAKKIYDHEVTIPSGVSWNRLEELIIIAEGKVASKNCENYLIKNKLVTTK